MWCQGSQVSMHVVRGSPSLFSSHGRGIGPIFCNNCKSAIITSKITYIYFNHSGNYIHKRTLSLVTVTADLKNALLEESDSCLQLCGKTCHNYFAASLLKRKPPLLAPCFCWNN